MAYSQDINKDMLFYSTWHAQNAANTLILEIEESTIEQCAKIDKLTAELLELIPAEILDSTGDQLLEANFDISTLLAYTKENSKFERNGTFDEERSCLTSSLASSQNLERANHDNLKRWKTPIKRSSTQVQKQRIALTKKEGTCSKHRNIRSPAERNLPGGFN